jgi:ABC-type anion transport system duplicated permease subunit
MQNPVVRIIYIPLSSLRAADSVPKIAFWPIKIYCFISVVYRLGGIEIEFYSG